ncbi:galactosylceramidase [Solihabitans fulvus]|uniref:galactosylceramidase n=1 Tax=Solihabitans fulvus TaxID=1892852 RepID=A0A5B2WKI2_9PSEU|nr:RICIN domain-containing protein [Solihabitans fulvus]KAA2250966.1 galactosylceramidase [Solihabitans fulvus]
MRQLRWPALILAVLAATWTAGLAPALAAAPAATMTITVDGASGGRVFDGIGAISGGGGNSRLLLDYPEPQRSQILDYMFKPGYGASLQILKVEIGGDANSTDGSESSHMHTSGDLNCDRGYEWWLMAQAKARNPNIALYGLAWGAPGWLGGGNFWSADTVTYLTNWLGCAKSHGLTIDYLGGWNERGYDKGWYENLHAAVANAGYPTRIVGADSGWDVADAMMSDPAFNASVDIVGTHYPCQGDGGPADVCSTTANSLATGKPLWASENGSQDDNSGSFALIRSITRGYVDAKMTAYLNWPLLAAIYPNLGYNTTGLAVANQPWSGNYGIGKSTWATAQVTQFTQPGWRFLDSASGFLTGNRAAGSYVSLKSPNGRDYSSIVETTSATAVQTVSFRVTGGLSTAPVHLWATNLNSSNPNDYFTHTADLTPSGGAYSFTAQPGYVYSLSTVGGQGRGTAASPPRASLALPYADDFDGGTPGREARYLSQQNGAFEVAGCGGGRGGRCVRQMAPISPINWDNGSDPYTLVGDLGWTDYTVTSDVLLEQPGAVQLMGRVTTQHPFAVAGIDAYYLQASDTGAWSIVRNDTNAQLTTLASGTVAALGTGRWHTLAVSFQGNTITAKIDGATVGSVADSTYPTGQAGLGVRGYQTDEFDNLAVTPAGAPPATSSYRLVNRNSGKVLEVAGSSTSDGALVDQATDTGAPAQQWQLLADGSGSLRLTNAGSGRALDLPGQAAGTQLDQRAPTGAQGQQWQLQPTADGYYTILGHGSGLVADVSGASTADGAPVIGWPVNGGANQQWRLQAVPTANVTYQLVNRASGLVADVSGASTADGGVVIGWQPNGGGNQHWRLAPSGGNYTLMNSGSGKVLDVPGATTTPDTQLEQWTYNGGANQQWQFRSTGDGYYQLVGAGNGLAVDMRAGSTAQGAAVVQNPVSTAPSQQWQLAAE